MRRAALVLAAVLALAGCANTPTVATGEAAAAPTTTAGPTTTSRRTTTPPPTTQAPDPAEEFSGTGDDVVNLAAPRELGVLTFECLGCDGNVVVQSDAGDLLVNEIGAYSGKLGLGFRSGTTSRLEIEADGEWTARVGPGDDATRHPGTQPVSGSGDDVLFLLVAPETARLDHSGESNFAVWVTTGTAGPDLVVNEVGTYEGRVLMTSAAGPAFVEVIADGDWTLTPDP